MMNVWLEKQKTMHVMQASMQLTIAQLAGAKKKSGGDLTLNDFLPDFCKEKKTPMEAEMKLKAAFMAMATGTKPKA